MWAYDRTPDAFRRHTVRGRVGMDAKSSNGLPGNSRLNRRTGACGLGRRAFAAPVEPFADIQAPAYGNYKRKRRRKRTTENGAGTDTESGRNMPRTLVIVGRISIRSKKRRG